MKKFTSIFLCGMLLCAAMSTANAQNSGTTGPLTWSFNEATGVLAITGEGAMPDYEYNSFPWFHLRTNIAYVMIYDGVTSIGDYAFYQCTNLISVTILNSVVLIGNNALFDCTDLISIEVASDNPNYSSENGVLFNKDKTTLIQYPIRKTETSYTIPNSVTIIGAGAFYNCLGLTSVTIPNSVVLIEDNTFHNCTGLTSVSIGNSVTTIGDRAFSYCTSLTEITNLATTPQAIEVSVFNGVNVSACTLRVPEGSQEAYRTADVWQDFLNIEGITVGINDNTLAGITVYGNGNSVYIVNKNSVTLKSVEIIDMQGRIVYDGRGRTFSTLTEEIPVNGAGGIYIVQLVSEDGKVLSAKVILND